MEKNIINELGSLALATRLKNLSERLARDVAQIYKESGVEFQPRWFAVVYVLKNGGKHSVTELSAILQQSHPAVNQVANVLVKKGLVLETKDKKDQRKRLLKLSAKGKRLVGQLEPYWDKIKAANDALLKDSANLLEALQSIEEALDRKSIAERVNSMN